MCSQLKTRHLLLAFFNGSVILLWLFFSFSFGMWGYCKINAMALPSHEVKDISADGQQTSGYAYKGITFRTAKELTSFINAERENTSYVLKVLQAIRLTDNGDVSKSVIFILTAVSFGIIGAITEQIKRVAVTRRERRRMVQAGQDTPCACILDDISILYRPLFGGLVGFMALGVTSLIPMLLKNTPETTVIRPTALLFFCFFSGLMSDEIYKWVTDLVLTAFKARSSALEVS